MFSIDADTTEMVKDEAIMSRGSRATAIDLGSK
jgi:hypothetical protein